MDALTAVTAATSILVVVFIAGQYSARLASLEKWREDSDARALRFESKLDLLLERRGHPRSDAQD